MHLESGTRVGSYEIRSRLGAGGMGEVYRALDTRLHRDVALKVLPDLFAADRERLARFEREAQVLASLNHPHIAAIYGLEQSDRSEGSGHTVRFLVLELVEGETLTDRLDRVRPGPSTAPRGGGLPLPEALAIAEQVAGGLQAAHERGIVHRDLKPSNIALTHDGHAKVLDFGLAKLQADAPADSAAPSSDPNAATMPPLAGLTQSPSTVPAAMTAAGMILGTAPYMSPEQAKGRPADKRSDVWAFGCVLYEMLTGRPAFSGEDVSDTLANVLKTDPDWSALPPDIPAAIRTLVQKCLDKDRRSRIADISVASFILDDPGLLSTTPAREIAGGAAAGWRGRAAIALVALLVGGALAGSTVWYLTRQRPAAVTRLAITTSSAAFVPSGVDRALAISADGRRVAYAGANGTILVRALDQLEPTVLTGLGYPRGLFFSPDGQWIGFFDGGAALKKIAVTGGSAITLCRTPSPARGGAWGADDTIVFATNDPASGLLRVPSGGGDPMVITTPNQQNGESDHWWPELFPDGTAVLFTIVPATTSLENARIAVLDLKTGVSKVLLDRGTDAHYLPSGHLVYAQAGSVRAVSFDPERMEVKGTPMQVLPQAVTTRFGAGVFDVAGNGTLVYRPSNLLEPQRTLVWVDRQGREDAIRIPARTYQAPRLSPDGKRVALEIQGDIYVFEVGQEAVRRITFDPALDQFPVWTRDGRIVFGSDRTSNGQANLFVQAADGSGSVERLTESANQQFPMSITPDGSLLVVRESAPNLDLMTLSMAGPKQPTQPLVKSSFAEQNAEISPDGKWLAYQSNESGGRFEIYVRPFPNVDGGRWQISTEGGIQPLWSKSGQELFYRGSNGTVMSVAVQRGATWSAGNPTKLFNDTYFHGVAAAAGRSYDVSGDGRFLMLKQAAGSEASDTVAFIVVQNWFEELKRVVPRK